MTDTTETADLNRHGPAAEGRGITSTSGVRRVGPLRLRRMSLTGVVLGLLAMCASVLPSLVPRAWYIEVALAGLAGAIAYGLGALAGWGYRSLELPNLPASARRGIWRGLAVLAPVALLVSGWVGRRWQVEQRELLGMDASVPWLWVLAPLLGVVLAAVLVGIGRGIRWIGQGLARLLGRLLPGRVAVALAVLVTAWATWYVTSGLLLGSALSAADGLFEGRNDDTKSGVVDPQSPYRSGGPRSAVTWESLGREGRQFVWQGRTAEQIAEVTGDADAAEPVRVFVGLESAPTPQERAALAVAELRRMGGFDRGAIAVAGGTGSGWIDPKAASALEFVSHGDVATVSMQYSYLPSWLSFLVDQRRAQSNAAELITAIRVELDSLSPDERPELYVYGESLGAFSTGSAFTSVEDMSTTTDGALMIGPPSFEPTWTRVQENREPGSPLWAPVYQDGALARAAATEADIRDPALIWATENRIIYLTHSSDPIVAWTADRAAWLDPRGADVHPQVRALPLVGGLQATFDQFAANSTPPGHGHVYDEIVAPAWAEILAPPALPAAEVEAIKDAVADVGDPS
jgi:uncharacterized membrane protein